MSTTYIINAGVLTGSGGGSGGSATVGFSAIGSGDQGKINAANAITIAINATTDANYTASSNEVDTVTITQGTVGIVGNKENTDAINGVAVSDFTGGGGPWTSAGGDYHASPIFSKNFPEGYEDLSIDVTTLVEEWLTGSSNGGKDNYGFGIKLSDSLEAATKSYYTKKFFARGTEFFFKRPSLEAKWNDSIQDDRGCFYASSSLAPASDNLNTLYLYNRIRGRLVNIPAVGTNDIEVSLYDSAGGSQIGTTFTGSYVSAGVYKCNVSADTTSTSIVDVWHSGGVEYHTGSITVKTESAEIINENTRYLLSIPNLNKEYRNTDKPRIKLYARPKNWSPTIYTVATSTPEATIIYSASYEICRSIDNLVVIPHDTGSNLSTKLSYNVSGNYFDLDMSYLESGYTYDIKFAFYDEYIANWNHQPYTFKFKVREDEY